MDMIIRRTRISDEQPLMDIGITDGKITAIEQAIEQTADQEIDAEGRVALPGFVEPHLHLEKAFLHRRLPPRFARSTKPFASPASLNPSRKSRTFSTVRGRCWTWR